MTTQAEEKSLYVKVPRHRIEKLAQILADLDLVAKLEPAQRWPNEGDPYPRAFGYAQGTIKSAASMLRYYFDAELKDVAE